MQRCTIQRQKHSSKKIVSFSSAFLPTQAFASEVAEVTGRILWAHVYSVKQPETFNKWTYFSDVIFPPSSFPLFKLNLVVR